MNRRGIALLASHILTEPPMDTPILRAFIGEKADYYLAAFEKISEKKNSWNWAAFCLGIGWLCYRRMYLYAAIIGVVMVVEMVIESALAVSDVVSSGISLGVWIAFGILGSRLYKAFTDKQIARLEAESVVGDPVLATAAARENPSMLMGFVGFFVLLALLFTVFFLLPFPEESF